jgi:hypothetical protein
MTSPPALEVASKCGNCGTGATTSLSLATGQALRLRGSRLELRPRRSIAPGPIPIYVYGLILLAPLCTFIHRSAWKENSAKSAGGLRSWATDILMCVRLVLPCVERGE